MFLCYIVSGFYVVSKIYGFYLENLFIYVCARLCEHVDVSCRSHQNFGQQFDLCIYQVFIALSFNSTPSISASNSLSCPVSLTPAFGIMKNFKMMLTWLSCFKMGNITCNT